MWVLLLLPLLARAAAPSPPPAEPFVLEITSLAVKASTASKGKPPPKAATQAAARDLWIHYVRRSPGQPPKSSNLPLREAIGVSLNDAVFLEQGKRVKRPRGWLRHFITDGVQPVSLELLDKPAEFLRISIPAPSAPLKIITAGVDINKVIGTSVADSKLPVETVPVDTGFALEPSILITHRITIWNSSFKSPTMWWPIDGPVKVRLGDKTKIITPGQIVLFPATFKGKVGILPGNRPARIFQVALAP